MKSYFFTPEQPLSMSPTTPVLIVWFRNDLRIEDNPALIAAARAGQVWPIYVYDTTTRYPMGGASKWWLHHSLRSLKQSLNGKLDVYIGDPVQILSDIAVKHHIKSVYLNRCYHIPQIEQEQRLKVILEKAGIGYHSFNGMLLWEPWEITKDDGSHYKVFTPFYRRGYSDGIKPSTPDSARGLLNLYPIAGNTVDLNLLDAHNWHAKLEDHWVVGERAANDRLAAFIEGKLLGYAEGRDYPAKDQTSRLSPHLHFGEISPNQVWWALESCKRQRNNPQLLKDIERCQIELVWREFSHYLLYYHPDLPERNLNKQFDHFPWRYDERLLKAWQEGKTGYPIIDAGMRQLWQTGYMHNRVRMLVASFLVKNALIDWRHGAAWFWDCLVDADLANNSASWQWVAGCGADAAPYFRIFNPTTQGERFDRDGHYTKRFVPELQRVPSKYLFKPWKALHLELDEQGVELERTYPLPILDLSKTRNEALAAFRSL